MTRLSDVEQELENLVVKTKFLEREIRNKTDDSQYRHVRRARDAKSHRRYSQSAARVTEEWERKKEPCRCGGEHNLIRFRNNDVWYTICPIKYYLLLCWQKVHNNLPVPDRSLMQDLLMKDLTERNDAQCSTCNDLGWIRYDVPFGNARWGKLYPCPDCAK